MEEQKPERNYYRGGYQKKITPEEIIADIKATAATLNMTDYISSKKYFKHGKHSINSIYKHLGSWKGALIKAGFKNLTRKSATYTDEELIADMHRVVKEFNLSENFTMKLYAQHSIYTPRMQIRHFGSWRIAMEKASIKRERKKSYQTHKITISDEEMIADMQQVATLLNKNNITKKEYNIHSKLSKYWHVVKRFNSWENALKKAGLKTPKQLLIPKNELLKELKRVAKKIKIDSVSITEYKNNNGKYNRKTIILHFGKWKNALKLAGLKSAKLGGSLPLPDEKLLDDLKRVANKMKKNKISSKKYTDNSGKYTYETFRNHFGSWKQALQKAGLG